jgi:hypothetical protein
MKTQTSTRISTLELLLVSVVFISAFFAAALAASHKPFWNDEAMSLSRMILIPWFDYFKGKTQEGSSAPLFFILLKILFIYRIIYNISIKSCGLNNIKEVESF